MAHLRYLSQAQDLAIVSVRIRADEQGCSGWGHGVELLQTSVQSLQDLATNAYTSTLIHYIGGHYGLHVTSLYTLIARYTIT